MSGVSGCRKEKDIDCRENGLCRKIGSLGLYSEKYLGLQLIHNDGIQNDVHCKLEKAANLVIIDISMIFS